MYRFLYLPSADALLNLGIIVEMISTPISHDFAKFLSARVASRHLTLMDNCQVFQL